MHGEGGVHSPIVENHWDSLANWIVHASLHGRDPVEFTSRESVDQARSAGAGGGRSQGGSRFEKPS